MYCLRFRVLDSRLPVTLLLLDHTLRNNAQDHREVSYDNLPHSSELARVEEKRTLRVHNSQKGSALNSQASGDTLLLIG